MTPRFFFAFEPIGYVRSPFPERTDAPRQPPAADGAPGRIELRAGHGYEYALEGLASWERVWIVFVFHKNVEQGRGWKPKVLPPRADEKKGVFATRSPHRPNPIGLSVVSIERVEGLVVHVRGLDLLDETPVLDLKPYVAYADAHPDARAGWLATPDPVRPWNVTFEADAEAQLEWLRAKGIDLRTAIVSALALGPQPHPYRRIRPKDAGFRLALKEWRVDFVVDDRRIVVRAVSSGYRPKELAIGEGLDVHRAFAAAWP